MDSATDGHEEDVAAAPATMAMSISGAAKRPGAAEFTTIYEAHFDFIWRSIRRLGVHDRVVDDAVQDVFVVVHRRLGDFEGRSSLKSWLFGIARRVAKDYRRRVERKEQNLVTSEGLADASTANPRDSAARSEAVRILHELLAAMDDDKREAFMLAELEQMSVPEIAAALDVNVNTVYSRLRAARKLFEEGVARHRATERRLER